MYLVKISKYLCPTQVKNNIIDNIELKVHDNNNTIQLKKT